MDTNQLTYAYMHKKFPGLSVAKTEILVGLQIRDIYWIKLYFMLSNMFLCKLNKKQSRIRTLITF